MKSAPRTLLATITLRVAALSLLMWLAIYAWAYYQIQISANRINEGSLVAQAKAILESVELRRGEVLFALPDELESPEGDRDGDFRYAVREGDRTLFASSWLPAQPDSVSVLDEDRHLYRVEHSQPERDSYTGSMIEADVQGRNLIVQVEHRGTDLEVLADTVLTEMVDHGAWLGIPFLLLHILVVSWTIRRAVGPLDDLSRQAASIGPLNTEVRLDGGKAPGEVQPLVGAMNAALDRLDDGFRRQREFTADAAHELRTPLAILCAHIETLDDRSLAESLGKDADLLTRIVSQLLKSAQLDGLAIASTDRADLCEVVDSVDELISPLAATDDKAILIGRPDAPVIVHGNEEAIFNSVRNLTENALRHSPPATTVELIVDSNGTVQVCDHGSGIPAEDLPHIFERFWRKNRSGAGAGLGLAIVKKTMELHSGAVEVSATPGGGTTFSLKFRKAET
jgi:signal transduction histidine kinase